MLLLSYRGGTSGEEDPRGEAGEVLPAIEQHSLVPRHIEAIDGIGLVKRTKSHQCIHIDVTCSRIDLDSVVGHLMLRTGVTHLDLEGSENAPNTSRKQLIFNTLSLFLSGIFCNLVADNQ